MKAIHVITLLALAMFIAGCASTTTDNEKATVGETAKETQEQVKATTTEPAKTSTTEKSLKDILSGAKLKYKADYKLTAAGETQTMSMAYDLPKFSQETKTEGVETKTIFDGTSFIVCTNQGEWQCFKMKAETPSSVKTEEDIKDGKTVPKPIGSCSVAGENGEKYELTAEGMVTTICYTRDGILLEMSTTDMSMTATKITRNIASSEFAPPVEPQDLSSMIPGGIPGQ